jgi:hypothetical protein
MSGTIGEGKQSMIENQADQKVEPKNSWLDFIPLVLSFFGALVSLWGALVTYLSQSQIPEASLWPLPGLILIDWVVLGLAGFFTTYLCFKQVSAKWLHVAWFITGAFIPLIILGAFSIGAGVLIVFIFFVLSTIILTIRRKGRLLASFGLLLLGSICNLGILFILITLGNPSSV